MKPTIVLVGRPNVGKSTLFNRLTRSRDAIVADIPGLTRDRHYGHGRVGDKPYLVVDTGGFEPTATEGILHKMAEQTRQAIDEADRVIFIVDARNGVGAPGQNHRQPASQDRPEDYPGGKQSGRNDNLCRDGGIS